jgi:hypothetical protein
MQVGGELSHKIAPKFFMFQKWRIV